MKTSIIKTLFLCAFVALMTASCQKNPVFTSIVVGGAKPTSVFTYNNSANALVVTFTSTSTNATSYFWQFGDGTTSTDAAPVHTYPTAAKYTVTLKVNSDAGYSATSSQVISAIPGAVANFTTSPYFELAYNFTNTSTTVASVSWDFGDGSAAVTTLSPIHKYSAAGTYNVKLTVTGLGGDVVNTTKAVVVANTNLLKGGGFEAGTGVNWSVWSSQANNPPVYGYAGDGPTGGYDACLRFPSFTNSAGFNELIYQAVQVTAGKQYKLSAVVKAAAAGKNDYLQFYISTDPNTWNENTGATSNFFLCLNNYHAWGSTSSSTTAVNGDLLAAVLANGSYGLGAATNGIYTATITGTVYVGIQCGVYGGTSNGDILVDNVSFIQIN
jgi:PKD repeat protein